MQAQQRDWEVGGVMWLEERGGWVMGGGKEQAAEEALEDEGVGQQACSGLGGWECEKGRDRMIYIYIYIYI
jgi:hypothetical protein